MGSILKLIKWLFVSFFCFTLLSLGAFVFAYFFPYPTFQLVEKFLLPADLKISWGSVKAEIDAQPDFHFLVSLNLKDFLMTKKDPFLRLPIADLNFKAKLFLRQKKMEIVELKILAPGKIEIGKLKNSLSENIIKKLYENAHHYITYKNILIQIQDINSYHRIKQAWHIDIYAHTGTGAFANTMNLKSQVRGLGDSPFLIELQGYLNPEKIVKNEEFAGFDLSFSGFSLDIRQKISAKYSDNKTHLILLGPINYFKDQMTILSHPETLLTFDSAGLDLNLRTAIQGLPGLIPKIQNLQLNFKANLDSEKPAQFSLQAPLELEFLQKNLREKLQKSCACELPVSIFGKASGEIWPKRLLENSPNRKNILSSIWSLESIKNKLFSLNLAATIAIEKVEKDWDVIPQLNCEAQVYDFQSILPIFENYKIQIPAPLNTLNGTLRLQAIGAVSQDQKITRLPGQLEVDLKSLKNHIKFKSDVMIAELNNDYSKAHIQVSAKIQDFQVELPALGPVGPRAKSIPEKKALKVLSKIAKSNKKDDENTSEKKSKFEMSFDLQLETAQKNAIRLFSSHFKPHLPLTLSFRNSPNEKSESYVHAEAFDAKYFKRDLHVEKFRMDLNNADEDLISVDGRYVIKKTQVTVYVDVKGNIKSPNIKFGSIPELAEGDIIAVLLYDKTTDQLTAAEVETEALVEGAVSNRSLGLLSLWALSSTSLRSFSFNPNTKIYNATVSLDDDTTTDIGSAWESSVLTELHKRVSKKWVPTIQWTATGLNDAYTLPILVWKERN